MVWSISIKDFKYIYFCSFELLLCRKNISFLNKIKRVIILNLLLYPIINKSINAKKHSIKNIEDIQFIVIGKYKREKINIIYEMNDWFARFDDDVIINNLGIDEELIDKSLWRSKDDSIDLTINELPENNDNLSMMSDEQMSHDGNSHYLSEPE